LANKSKTVLIIILGLILVGVGVLASVFLIQRFRSSRPALLPEELIVRTSVVVVTRDLFLGDTITQNDVELADVPVEIAPRTAISSLNDVIGKMIKSDLVQGQMVLSHNLADPTNQLKDLSFVLSDQHVLLAFPGDDLMSREGIIQRGDIVDIFATFSKEVESVGDAAASDEESSEVRTRTFTVDAMQRVGVTALILDTIEQEGESTAVQDQAPRSGVAPRARIRAYLLALNPRDALILKNLKDTGAVFDIVLRAPTSTVQFDLTPVTEEYIIEFYGLEILP